MGAGLSELSNAFNLRCLYYEEVSFKMWAGGTPKGRVICMHCVQILTTKGEFD